MCVLLALSLSGLGIPGILSAAEQSPPFPAYGSGSVEVRLYTDYFCPPCRSLEPEVEPILMDLLKHGAIRLTLVDVPFSQHTPLYARNFLYALRKNNDPEHAFRVRNVLQSAAASNEIETQEQVEALFRERSIPYSIWDTKPAFDRYNALIKEDKVDTTPTCIVKVESQQKTYIGGSDVINAIKALSLTCTCGDSCRN